jgi:hypothetical protein
LFSTFRSAWQIPRIQKTIKSVFFLSVAALLALHCYRTPRMSVDLLSYAGNVALLEKGDVVQAHRSVYAEDLTPHLRGTDSDDQQARVLRRRASDPFYAAAYLPYFSVKPLYVTTLGLLHRAGLSLSNSIHTVSALCYFGIAVLLWIYTRSLLSLLVVLLPEVVELGQANGPDAMSVFLLLLGFWFLFVKNRDLGILPVIVSVWVRPESVIVTLSVLAAMYFTGRIDWKQTSVLAFLSVVSVGLISHFGYGWKSLYYHTFLAGEPGAAAYFAWADYRGALAKGVADLSHSAAVLYGLLWIISFARCSRSTRSILGLSGFYLVSRFLLFPSYEPRFYGLFFLCTAIAGVSVFSGAGYSGARRQGTTEVVSEPNLEESATAA